MFICGLCGQPSKPGEKMLRVPRHVKPPTGTMGPQIRSEIALAPDCAKRYVAALAEAAPGVNPQSAYAALVQ